MGMGIVLPLIAFPILRFAGRLPRPDAASIAAHYGSVSVATFAVASSYFTRNDVSFEAHTAFLLTVLEIPAIFVGILLAREWSRKTPLGTVLHEVFLGKGIVLLVGGLLIGWAAGENGLSSVKPLFFDLFKGILALYLLEMGLITSAQFGSLKRHGLFLVGFAILMPVAFSVIGILLGKLLGLSFGGSAMLGVFAASSSYIAVPAAMRISVPEANPTPGRLLGRDLSLQRADWHSPLPRNGDPAFSGVGRLIDGNHAHETPHRHHRSRVGKAPGA